MEANNQNTATLVSQYQYVRGESKREYDQIATRMGWSLMAQTFLFGALALSSSTDAGCSKSASELIDTLRYRLVPILGLVTSFVPLMGIWGAHLRITDWRKKQYEIEKIPALGKGRIENYMTQEHGFWGDFAHIIGHFPSIFMLPAFFSAWIYILHYGCSKVSNPIIHNISFELGIFLILASVTALFACAPLRRCEAWVREGIVDGDQWLITCNAIGIGLLIGLAGCIALPHVLPEPHGLNRWGILLWYTTLGAIIGILGVYAWHPAFKLPLPWWVRAPLIGAWMNFVLFFFAYDVIAGVMGAMFDPDGIFATPFWFVAEGALVGLIIGYFANRFAGKGIVTTVR